MVVLYMRQSSAELLARTAADEAGLMDFTYKIKVSDMYLGLNGKERFIFLNVNYNLR